MTINCRLRILAAYALAACSIAAAQTPAQPVGCNPWKIQTFSFELSLADRTCYEFSELASPALAVESGLVAGLSQWRNSPHMRKNDQDDVAVRFVHLYERRTARITGEWLVGYLHHEDPRLRFSGQQGNWHRMCAALLSVLNSPDQDGHGRLALAPLAGSLGSGLTSMALYQRQNTISYGLERSGLVYSHYFIRAIFHEFSPELWSLAPPFIRKYHVAPKVMVD